MNTVRVVTSAVSLSSTTESTNSAKPLIEKFSDQTTAGAPSRRRRAVTLADPNVLKYYVILDNVPVANISWVDIAADAVKQWNSDANSLDYKILQCPLYTEYGSAVLGLPHPSDSSKTYAFVLVVLSGENVTDPTTQCTPREKIAEQLEGGLQLPDSSENKPTAEPIEEPGTVRLRLPRPFLNMFKPKEQGGGGIIAVLVEVYFIPIPYIGFVPAYKPGDLPRPKLKEKVTSGEFILVAALKPDNADGIITAGGSFTSKRRRRRAVIESPGDVSNAPLTEPTYLSFSTAVTPSGDAISSAFSQSLQTLPAGAIPGMYCSIQKDCNCLNVTEVNSTVISGDVAYIGVNNTYVNASISNVGKWDAEKIKLICKDSACDSAALIQAQTDIQTDIDSIQGSIDLTKTARLNLQKSIDCAYNNGTRSELFGNYEALCGRMIYMTQSIEDLKIKKQIIMREEQRCSNRGWLRSILENMWHKG
ncbi:uncharacterized protein [Clytia hemisphaerica]|uniref:Uncharacterized protein n=1 Tax=Clytia hemisphaerica TaxID=252671 RepID=A0A7M5WIV3_9CNID